MLPNFLDLSHLSWLMWAFIFVGAIVILLVIKNVEAAMLRVFVSVLIATLCLASYFYQKELTECKNKGTDCSFFGYKVPNVDTGLND